MTSSSRYHSVRGAGAKTLSVRSLGYAGKAAFERASVARVVAVFARGFYLIADTEDIVFVGDAGCGRGPLNALGLDVTRHGVRINDVFHIATPHARCNENNVIIDISSAATWDPRRSSPGRKSISVFDLQIVAQRLLVAIDTCREPRGLLRVLTGEAGSQVEARARFRDALGGTAQWLKQAANDRLEPSTARTSMLTAIGAGGGLTPSGDDYFVGALLALNWMGCAAQFQELAGLVNEHTHRTNQISAAHLRCATQGVGAEALHEVWDAALSNDMRLNVALSQFLSRQHDSPWDALCGLALAVSVMASPATCNNMLTRLNRCYAESAPQRRVAAR